jgi:hypothetical protein
MDFYSPSSLKQQSTGILFAPLQAVKKEILKKRALMEKNLQQDIQV